MQNVTDLDLSPSELHEPVEGIVEGGCFPTEEPMQECGEPFEPYDPDGYHHHPVPSYEIDLDLEWELDEAGWGDLDL